MENEDEDASKLSNPPVQVEHNSMSATTAAAAAIMDSQCKPESATELSEPQLPSQEQSLVEGTQVSEDSTAGELGAAPQLGEAEVAGGDESRDSQLVDTAVVGEEDGEETIGVANALDVMSGGDLAVEASVVVVGVDDEDVIGKKDREVADGAEETEEKVLVADAAEKNEEKTGVVEDVEVAGEAKAIDVAQENEERTGMTEEKEIADEGKAVNEIEDETRTVEVAGTTDIVDDVAAEMDERTQLAEDVEIAGWAKVVNFADKTEIADGTKDVAGVEEVETAVHTEAVDAAVETEERREMAEDRGIGGEIKEFDAAADKEEIVKEVDVAGLSKETEFSDDEKVADVTEATTADEMKVGDVAEDTEMQDYEMEFADVAEGEREFVEEKEEETEMVEATETDPEMEMADLEEEAMEAGTDVGDETDKADMAEEMETGEDVEEVSKTVGGKRKRLGKNSKPTGRVPPRKKVEEDVCFICFDGGDLVLCDRR